MCKEGEIHLVKIQSGEEGGEEEKVIVKITAHDLDEETDVLKFAIQEGNVYQLKEILNEFDEKIMNETE